MSGIALSLSRPACGIAVSRQEDTKISERLSLLANSLSIEYLRDSRRPRFVALPLPSEGVLYDSGSSMKHLALLLSIFTLSTAAHAQASPSSMPESHRPPAGMCRIWIDGVPPAHQPAPTDCATAIRKRPMNARVVFGNEAPEPAVRSNFVAPPATPRDDEARRAPPPPPPPPPPAPPASQRNQDRSAPPPRPRVEKASRPPHESYSAHRPR